MSVSDQVHMDLQQAMKRRDKVRVATLRLLRAALHNRAIAKGGALEENETLEVITHAAKQRRETIAFARQHGREEIAQQEENELAILTEYLPKPLSIEDLQQRINAVVEELGATSPKDIGRVMKVLMPTVQGQADGQTVNRLVRERLA